VTHRKALLCGSIQSPCIDTRESPLPQQHSPLSVCCRRLAIAGIDRRVESARDLLWSSQVPRLVGLIYRVFRNLKLERANRSFAPLLPILARVQDGSYINFL
jgi:hypothetical protein